MKKTLKSKAAILLSGFAVAGMLAGCGGKTDAPSAPTAAKGEAASGKKLVVGTMPLTVGVPVQYALDKGYYEEEGLDVEIVIFSTGAPINEAFAAGQIDIAASGLASVYSLANAGAKWIGEINTTGGMGIYVRPDSPVLQVKGQAKGAADIYGSAELVKGMKILGPLGTTAQFNAIGYAGQFGLGSADFEQVHMEYGPAYQAFQSGEGDAFAANPPFSFQAEEAGYICAGTFEDCTGVSLLDGIFATSKVSEERREDVVKFIKATYRACDELQDYDTRFSFSKEWFNANGKEYDDKTLESEIKVRAYMTGASMTEEGFVFGEGMKAIAEFFTSDGKIEKENLPKVVESYDVSILKEALGVDIKVQD